MTKQTASDSLYEETQVDQLQVEQAINNLRQELRTFPGLAIAVSGGVDSLTLAVLASKEIKQVEIFHAVSPAVPPSATERVKRLAQKFKWHLTIIDAGEMSDERYRSNPLNRCYFCKQNLYQTIRSRAVLPIAAGTNTDDLSDYRPGLLAADEAKVFHPYVEAGLSKNMVRVLAGQLGLDDVADLPASPCLSSRVMTGVTIQADLLPLIDKAEEFVKERLPQCETVRCRIHESAVVIQLSIDSLMALSADYQAELCASVGAVFAELAEYSYLAENISIASYVMGSAFDQNSKSVLQWEGEAKGKAKGKAKGGKATQVKEKGYTHG